MKLRLCGVLLIVTYGHLFIHCTYVDGWRATGVLCTGREWDGAWSAIRIALLRVSTGALLVLIEVSGLCTCSPSSGFLWNGTGENWKHFIYLYYPSVVSVIVSSVSIFWLYSRSEYYGVWKLYVACVGSFHIVCECCSGTLWASGVILVHCRLSNRYVEIRMQCLKVLYVFAVAIT